MQMDRYSLEQLPVVYSSLVQEIKQLSGGIDLVVWGPTAGLQAGSSYFDGPALVPTIVLPADLNEEWKQIGFQIIGLLRALQGIPELVSERSPDLARIAADINQALERIAIRRQIRQRGLPVPGVDNTTPEQIRRSLALTDMTSVYPGFVTFRIFQLLMLKEDGIPGWRDIFIKIRKKFPSECKIARGLADRIRTHKLDSACDKAIVVDLLIGRLGFERNDFTLKKYQPIISNATIASLLIQANTKELSDGFPSPKTIIGFQLPFKIPADEGIYAVDNNLIALEHKEIENPRATWIKEGNVTIDSILDQSGLYSQSVVRMTIAGAYVPDARNPPEGELYEAYKSYPDLYHLSLSLLNKFIAWVRQHYDRPDTPSATLLHINKADVTVFSEPGTLIYRAPSISMEQVKFGFGLKRPEPLSISKKPNIVNEIPYYKDLISNAKRHIIESNPRAAVLDLFGAFESFLAMYISSRIDVRAETNKERFIRVYGKDINDENLLKFIRDLKDRDNEQSPSVHSIVSAYKKSKQVPLLDGDAISSLFKVSGYRNDAAHGRKLPTEIVSILVDGIKALERISTSFEE